MSSQNNDGIEYTIQENDKTETPEEQPIPKGNGVNDLPPHIRSQLPESFGETVNHSHAYVDFLKNTKIQKKIAEHSMDIQKIIWNF
jgi:hypothetical protein